MTKALRYAISGVIMIVVGRMAAAGRLPRNLFAGIRIPSTLRTDEAWLAGHRAASTALTVAGLGPVVVAAVVAAKRPSTDSQRVLSRVSTAWLLSWLGLATVQASRAARATEAG
ncbi:MAG: SdpI family protein [Acidimicrobiales bacterium]